MTHEMVTGASAGDFAGEPRLTGTVCLIGMDGPALTHFSTRGTTNF